MSRRRAAIQSFGEVSDEYIAAHEATWRNPQTPRLMAHDDVEYARPLREKPVDQTTADVLAVLKPCGRAAETKELVARPD